MADTLTRYDSTYDARAAELDEDDAVQHGIDGDPHGDAEKGAVGGGIGGAIVGATAGAMVGPGGALLGAVIGAVAGSLASGEAVSIIDRHDNDNSVTGLGTTPTYTEPGDPYVNSADTGAAYETTLPADRAYASTAGVGNGIPGIQTGGHDIDGRPDTRGVWEKTEDAITGDKIDDKTGEPVAYNSEFRGDTNTLRGDTVALRDETNAARSAANSGIGTGFSRESEVGEKSPSFKTGGVANDGTPDTRGVGEKIVDGLTGDDVDDKTGRIVDHP